MTRWRRFLINSLMEDAQSEFVLLRSCLSLPKIMFTLRTTDPTNHYELWERYDNITRESISRILGTPLSDTEWRQATLPVSQGGLGLRASCDHAPAAYTTSLLGSQDLKLRMLGLNAEDSPPTVSATLLESLTARTGTDVNMA